LQSDAHESVAARPARDVVPRPVARAVHGRSRLPVGRSLEGSEIRVAGQQDLPLLEKALGQVEYFEDRLRQQDRGCGVLLVAWSDDRTPVGDVYVRIEDADEFQLRTYLPGVPLLHHLEVQVDERNRGIGTRLVAAAEQWLIGRGYGQLAFGVEIHNVAALRLYRRLGYRDWGHGRVECSCELPRAGGGRTHGTETCNVFVKDLLPPRACGLGDVRAAGGAGEPGASCGPGGPGVADQAD
jgi:GNAT superfamily N-acetyltransferase